MKTKLFVGNLNFDTKDDELRKLFETYGQIESITIVTDKRSGRSKGYGFVQMIESKDAAQALELSGREFMGRDIVVTEADSPGEGQSRRDRNPRAGGRRFKGDRNDTNSRGPGRNNPSQRDLETQKQGWWSRLLKVFGGGGDSQNQPSRSQASNQSQGHSSRPQHQGRKNFRRRPPRQHDVT